MDGPRTMKEALYREMIGDLSGILDRIEAMQNGLPGQEEALRKATEDATIAIQAVTAKGATAIHNAVSNSLPVIHETVAGAAERAVRASLAGSVMQDVSKAARSAIVGRQLGQSMLTLWGGAVVLAVFSMMGYAIGSHIYVALQTHAISLHTFWEKVGYQSAVAVIFPTFLLAAQADFGSNRNAWWQTLFLLIGTGGGIVMILLAFGWI